MKSISFIHIPKTAGGSIIQTIGYHFTAENCIRVAPCVPHVSLVSRSFAISCFFFKHYTKKICRKFNIFDLIFQDEHVITYGRKQYSLYSEVTPIEMRFYSGHIAAGIDKNLFEFDARISIVRDPVERYYSWFYHQKRDPRSKFFRDCNNLTPSVVLTKLRHENHVEADNPQVRYLGLCGSKDLLNDAKKSFDLLYTQEDIVPFLEALLNYLNVDFLGLQNINKNSRVLKSVGYRSEPDFSQVQELAFKYFSQDFDLYCCLREKRINSLC